jgi:predicted membrane protein
VNKAPEEREWSRRSPGARLFFAAFLIAAGTLLFLSNLGILPLRNIWSYWPLVVIGLGISRIVSGPDSVTRLFGALVTLIATLFLLINLQVLHIRSHDGSWPISILLIAFGMAMLIKLIQRQDPSQPVWGNFGRSSIRSSSANVVSDLTVMGSIKRRLDAADFNGGSALCILGNIELDLRHTRITEPGQTVHLEVSAILGAAKIRVPETWRVRIHGAGIMGNYEDKTVPQASGAEAPTLVVTGYSILGTVEIED